MAQSRPHRSSINKVTMTMEMPTSGSYFKVRASVSSLQDFPETSRGARFDNIGDDAVLDRADLGVLLASGCLVWPDPSRKESNFLLNDGLFWHVPLMTLKECKSWWTGCFFAGLYLVLVWSVQAVRKTNQILHPWILHPKRKKRK